jgi:hypothetical protein
LFGGGSGLTVHPNLSRNSFSGFDHHICPDTFQKPNTINRLPKTISENFPNRTRTESESGDAFIGVSRETEKLRKLNFWKF